MLLRWRAQVMCHIIKSGKYVGGSLYRMPFYRCHPNTDKWRGAIRKDGNRLNILTLAMLVELNFVPKPQCIEAKCDTPT
jgi:hypothetical protein